MAEEAQFEWLSRYLENLDPGQWVTWTVTPGQRHSYQVFAQVPPFLEEPAPEQESDLVATWRQHAEHDGKGRKLFLSLLRDDQKEQLAREGCFQVTGSRGGLYRIRCTSVVYNVDRIHRRWGNFMYKLCAGPQGVTCNDFWLAQKLMLEASERKFLDIANRGYDY